MSLAVKKPILYFDDSRPQARSVLMLIKLLNADVQLRYVDMTKGENTSIEYVKLNPSRNVPTLVHNDVVLTDSHVILMYLCDHHPSEFAYNLFPHEPIKRMDITDKLFFSSGFLLRRHSEFLEELLRKSPQETDLEYHCQRVHECYDIIDMFLQSKLFVAGNKFSIADIAIIPTISALNMLFPINEKWMFLQGWFKNARARPEYQVNRIGLAQQRDIITAILEKHVAETNANDKAACTSNNEAAWQHFANVFFDNQISAQTK